MPSHLFMDIRPFFCYLSKNGDKTLDSNVLNNKQMLLKSFKDLRLLNPPTDKKASISNMQTSDAMTQLRIDNPENRPVVVMLSMEAKHRASENSKKKQRKKINNKKQNKKRKFIEN